MRFRHLPVVQVEVRMGMLMRLAALAALLAGCAAETGGFTSRYGDRVETVDGSVFEVTRRSAGENVGGWDYWCGAGEFARRSLDADWQDPVYVQRGLTAAEGGANAIAAVRFTLEQGALSQEPSVMGADEIGAFRIGHFMTVQDATALCSKWPGRV